MIAEQRDRGHPIQIAWRELRKHGEACDICGDLIAELAQVPDDPRRADRELHPQFCEDGRELHGAWVAAKDEWLETTRDGRRRLGVLGASDEAVELRDAAWARLPGPERMRLLALPDAERFRLLEAVEAGILAERRARPVPPTSGNGPAWVVPHSGRRPRTCEQCGREHQSHGRYCTPECRRLAARPRLEGTDE